MSGADAVAAGGRAHGPAADPRAGGGAGVEVVDGPAAGIRAVEGVPGGPVGRVGHRLVNLPVHHAGEGPGLVHHPGHGVGEGGVLHPVEDHRPHRHLAAVGLPPGLGGDHPGQQLHGALLAGAAAPRGHAQGLQGGRAHDAVGGEAVLPLEVPHRLGGARAEDAVHRAVVVAPVFQLGLDDAHLLAGGALPVGGRLGLLGQADDCDVDREQKGQRPRQPPSVGQSRRLLSLD